MKTILFILVMALSLEMNRATVWAEQASSGSKPSGAGTPALAGKLGFKAGSQGEFTFDTGVLRGKLHANGKAFGLAELVHIPTGQRLDSSVGIFSHYRVFTANKRYGTAAWEWPGTSRLLDNGAVEYQWPAVEGRPFELRARYQWMNETALALETTVIAQQKLERFEVFLASYFQKQFTNALAYVKAPAGQPAKPGFMEAGQKWGIWQMYPRDDAAVTLIQDGRWKIEPNPVDWIILPRLASPLGMRRDPLSGLSAILLARPEDCFALAMPHQTEGHYSLYFSLFGRDVKAGETAKVQNRLHILVKPTDQQVLGIYQQSVSEMRRE